MRVLAIPDLHSPYEHPQALSFLRMVAAQFRTNRVVCLGDEIDAHAFSRFAKSPDLDAPGREVEAAREHLQPFYDTFPNALVCESNHPARIFKRASEAGLPSRLLVDLRQALGTPRGWKYAECHYLDGVAYIHGDGYSGRDGALNAAIDARRPTVIGHLHAHAGVTWLATRGGSIFGCSAGCLINPKSQAFDYGKHFRRRPLLGCAVILDGVPTFVPMEST